MTKVFSNLSRDCTLVFLQIYHVDVGSIYELLDIIPHDIETQRTEQALRSCVSEFYAGVRLAMTLRYLSVIYVLDIQTNYVVFVCEFYGSPCLVVNAIDKKFNVTISLSNCSS